MLLGAVLFRCVSSLDPDLRLGTGDFEDERPDEV